MKHCKSFLVLLALLAVIAWAASTAVTTQRIVIIGDSTVCNYAASAYPWAGWGQELALYFKSGSVSITNKAIGGRSSRSFYTGQWAGTLAILQSGDILMIQFGHNDRDYSDTSRYTDTSAYKMYLGKYVTEARAKGVHPVFVTPMNMNTWTNATTVREVFTERSKGADYRGAMIRVADSLKVPVLDLEKKSKLLMDTMGGAYMGRFHFLGLDSATTNPVDTAEYSTYPAGKYDGTHFQELGALENARMIVEEIARQSTDSVLSLLAPRIAPLYKVTVTTNYATGGDTLTKTRWFPKGATVTLKCKPIKGHTFQYWANSTGKSVTTQLRHVFTQDTLASTWIAVFAQGTSVVVQSSSSVAVSSSNKVSSSSSAVLSSSRAVVSSSSRVSSSSTTALSSSSVPLSSSSGAVGIQITNMGQGQVPSVKIYDTMGHLVYTGQNPSLVQWSMLPHGNYIVKLFYSGLRTKSSNLFCNR